METSDFNKSAYFRHRLQEELVHRIQKNPQYSMRSFANTLGIAQGALSLILAGKRSISVKLIDRILNSLELSPVEQKKFLESVIAEKGKLQRLSPKLRAKVNETQSHLRGVPKIERQLGLEEFRVLSEWYHSAILELTYSKHFQSNPSWVANALGITPIEAKLAIDRLLELKLLTLKDGVLTKTDFNLDTKDKSKTSTFLKKRQKQSLEKSIYSLENDPIDERNHSALTVCVDPAQLAQAKIKIQKFMWELGQLLVRGEAQRVYELNVSLFPLQKKMNKKTKEKQ